MYTYDQLTYYFITSSMFIQHTISETYCTFLALTFVATILIIHKMIPKLSLKNKTSYFTRTKTKVNQVTEIYFFEILYILAISSKVCYHLYSYINIYYQQCYYYVQYLSNTQQFASQIISHDNKVLSEPTRLLTDDTRTEQQSRKVQRPCIAVQCSQNITKRLITGETISNTDVFILVNQNQFNYT